MTDKKDFYENLVDEALEENPEPTFEEFGPVTIEQWLSEGYKELSFVEKILYHIQLHAFLTILGSLIVGYFAGATFGKFW